MTDLQRALYEFAQERRIPDLLRSDQGELRGNRRMAEEALEALRSQGEKNADLVQRVESGWFLCAALEREAGFLAGLTIGLELGRE